MAGWLGLAAGVAKFLAAIQGARGRRPSRAALGSTGVLLIAGIASLARYAPGPLQVGGLMFATGLIGTVMVVVFLEFWRGRRRE